MNQAPLTLTASNTIPDSRHGSRRLADKVRGGKHRCSDTSYGAVWPELHLQKRKLPTMKKKKTRGGGSLWWSGGCRMNTLPPKIVFPGHTLW